MTAIAQEPLDVVIVGAGISGIGMAAHMGMISPDRSYAILERRERIGGTWDLFRYPGVPIGQRHAHAGVRFRTVAA